MGGLGGVVAAVGCGGLTHSFPYKFFFFSFSSDLNFAKVSPLRFQSEYVIVVYQSTSHIKRPRQTQFEYSSDVDAPMLTRGMCATDGLRYGGNGVRKGLT